MPNSLIVVQLVDRLPPPGHSTHPDALYSANQRVARLASQARCKRAPTNRILRLMGARDIGCATGARYPGPEGTRFVRHTPAMDVYVGEHTGPKSCTRVDIMSDIGDFEE